MPMVLLIAIVGLMVGLLVWMSRRRKAEREGVLKNGVPTIAWIVQANSALFQPGSASAPAQVLISFDGSQKASLEQLSEITQRIGRLKVSPPSNPTEKKVAALVRNEAYRPSARNLLPMEFTAGLEVYSAHVWVDRSLLPAGRITLPYLSCMATPGAKGKLYHVREIPASGATAI